MTTVSTHVEFHQGIKGPLFRIIRTPAKVLGHLLFIAPLFEQANKTRHHVTRSAINAYQFGLQSIVFDHYGTGDSAGDLIDASMLLWQQDIVQQVNAIKARSSQAIYLSLPLSAALLLSNELLDLVDGVMLLQPDFNGKRFVKQFQRLAVVAQLTKNSKIEEDNTIRAQRTEQQTIEIAGYVITPSLLSELSGQSLAKLAQITVDCYWFEWQNQQEELSLGRAKQQQVAVNKSNHLVIEQVDDVKFWQATELQLAQSFLIKEQQAFAKVVSASLSFSAPEVVKCEKQ